MRDKRRAHTETARIDERAGADFLEDAFNATALSRFPVPSPAENGENYEREIDSVLRFAAPSPLDAHKVPRRRP